MDGIRREAPKLHISIKINSNDFAPGGLTPYESMIIAEKLSEKGIDSIEVSGNNTSVQGVMPGLNEAYFMAFAEALAEKVQTPVILVGGIRSEEMMNGIINGSDIAMLSLSRPLIKTPDFPKLLKNGATDKSDCISCNQCYSTYAHQCIFNGGRKL